MGVDVGDVAAVMPASSMASSMQRTAPSPRGWRGDVVRVGGRARTEDLGDDRGTALDGHVPVFEDQDAGALRCA